MRISVTCRHMDTTDALREHAMSKVEHDFHEFPRVLDVHVILDVQRHLHIAEVVVKGSNHISVEGKEESDDMYYSIDSAVEKAARQLRKQRDKDTDHKHTDGLSELELEALRRES